MHDLPLVCTHRPELYAALLPARPFRCLTGHFLELHAPPGSISLDVDHDRVALTQLLVRDSRDQRLERLEGLAVTADEDAEISTDDIEDDFALVALILDRKSVV